MLVGLDKDNDGDVTGEERSRADKYIREGAEKGEL